MYRNKRIVCVIALILMMNYVVCSGYADDFDNNSVQNSIIEQLAADETVNYDDEDFSSKEAFDLYFNSKLNNGYNPSEEERKIYLSENISEDLLRITTVNKTATKAITLQGLTNTNVSNKAIQAFYIGSSYVYTVQHVGTTVYLSRLLLSNNNTVATYQDHMTLNHFGHCQSLDYYSINGDAYFIMACKDDDGYSVDPSSGNPYYWSTQIARVKYQANASISYTNFERLSAINKANPTGTSAGDLIRCDAAVSSDYKWLFIWSRVYTDSNHTVKKMQFSRYDLEDINDIWDANPNTYVSCGSNAVKAACVQSAIVTNSSIYSGMGTTSMQGGEINNSKCPFIACGANNATKYILKTSSAFSLTNRICIANPTLAAGTNTEIEGLQIKNYKVYFGIVDHTPVIQNNGIQYIYYLPTSDFN